MGGSLVILTIFAMLQVEVWPVAEAGRLKSPLVMFMALMFSIGITATAGSALGFWLLARSREISTPRILVLGGLFGVLAHFSYLPLLNALGVVGGAAAFVLSSAFIAFLGGLVLSRNESVVS